MRTTDMIVYQGNPYRIMDISGSMLLVNLLTGQPFSMEPLWISARDDYDVESYLRSSDFVLYKDYKITAYSDKGRVTLG